MRGLAISFFCSYNYEYAEPTHTITAAPTASFQSADTRVFAKDT